MTNEATPRPWRIEHEVTGLGASVAVLGESSIDGRNYFIKGDRVGGDAETDAELIVTAVNRHAAHTKLANAVRAHRDNLSVPWSAVYAALAELDALEATIWSAKPADSL